jgi:hypothetical protein
VREGITLETGAIVNIPLVMRPGETTQTVVVNADTSLLNTESSSIGQVLTTIQRESLPATGSNLTSALRDPGPRQLTELSNRLSASLTVTFLLSIRYGSVRAPS